MTALTCSAQGIRVLAIGTAWRRPADHDQEVAVYAHNCNHVVPR